MFSLARRKNLTIEVSDDFRFNVMRMILGSLHPYFARMEWEVAPAGEGSSFITSDNPVSFSNIDIFPPFEAGIALVGAMVFFPLDPEHLLILRHPELINDQTVPRLKKFRKLV